MYTIEIDFDVFKELTIRRKTEQMTHNDVIRDLLGLDQNGSSIKKEIKDKGAPFVSKGFVFPHGTKLRALYKGKYYTAEVDDGVIVYNNQKHTSFSSAARAVSSTNVNGWIFWECLRPNENNWIPVEDLKNRGSQFVSG